jgi:hypothetical protein
MALAENIAEKAGALTPATLDLPFLPLFVIFLMANPQQTLS